MQESSGEEPEKSEEKEAKGEKKKKHKKHKKHSGSKHKHKRSKHKKHKDKDKSPVVSEVFMFFKLLWAPKVATCFATFASKRVELTTPENTITYHNAVCLSPQILHKPRFQFLLGPF